LSSSRIVNTNSADHVNTPAKNSLPSRSDILAVSKPANVNNDNSSIFSGKSTRKSHESRSSQRNHTSRLESKSPLRRHSANSDRSRNSVTRGRAPDRHLSNINSTITRPWDFNQSEPASSSGRNSNI
jgi:hypothetical protein